MAADPRPLWYPRGGYGLPVPSHLGAGGVPVPRAGTPHLRQVVVQGVATLVMPTPPRLGNTLILAACAGSTTLATPSGGGVSTWTRINTTTGGTSQVSVDLWIGTVDTTPATDIARSVSSQILFLLELETDLSGWAVLGSSVANIGATGGGGTITLPNIGAVGRANRYVLTIYQLTANAAPTVFTPPTAQPMNFYDSGLVTASTRGRLCVDISQPGTFPRKYVATVPTTNLCGLLAAVAV